MMETCCASHLVTAAQECIPKSKNASVTVTSIKNLSEHHYNVDGSYRGLRCWYCKQRAEFKISYCPKEQPQNNYPNIVIDSACNGNTFIGNTSYDGANYKFKIQ